jgi:MoxR-like ATPase
MGKFTEVDDLIGSPQYDPDIGTYFKEGRLPRNWERPGVNDVDEINLARGEIREFFRPLTDNSKQFVLDADSGLVKERHHASFLIFTMNPPWDVRNTGTEDFAAADSNRLSPIWIDNPPEAVERHIIIQRCKLDGYDIPADLLDVIIKCGEDIRLACEDGSFPDWWGTRQSIKVARKTKWYSLAKSFKRASLDFYDPQTVDDLLSLIQSHVA